MEKERIPIATHHGVLKIGDIELQCYVLDDGRRVLSQRGFLTALGRVKTSKTSARMGGDVEVPPFLAPKNLKRFIDADLLAASKPIRFVATNKKMASGHVAELLPAVCGVFLEAKDAGVLTEGQKHIANQCRILVRGFATVGIIALIDEATGYQEIRDKIALQKILEKYISKELMPWTKLFPDPFYEEIFRLRDWQWKGRGFNPPQVVGKYTNDIIYERLAPGVLKELKKINPPDEKGKRKHKFTQWLTVDVGHPKLNEHISAVMALMRASSNWTMFKRLLVRAFPKFGESPELKIEDD